MLYREIEVDDSALLPEGSIEAAITPMSRPGNDVYWLAFVYDPQATADAALGRMVRGMPTGSVLVHGMMGWTAGMFSRVEYDFNGPQCDMPEAALAALEEEAADDDEIR